MVQWKFSNDISKGFFSYFCALISFFQDWSNSYKEPFFCWEKIDKNGWI